MSARWYISLMMLAAFVLFQAHSLVPHLHATHPEAPVAHHHHSHLHGKSHDHPSPAGHDIPLKHAAHEVDFGKLVIKPEDGHHFGKKLVRDSFVSQGISFLFQPATAPIPPSWQLLSVDIPLRGPTLLPSLRAPPVFMSI